MWDECMLFYLKKKRKILSHLTTPWLYMSMWAGWGVSKVVNLSSKTSFSPKKSANLSDIWPHPGPTCPCGRRSHVCHVSGGGPWYTRVNDKTGNVQILGGNNICPRFKRNWSTHVYYNTLCPAFRSNTCLPAYLCPCAWFPTYPVGMRLKEGPLAGLAHLFTLGTKPNLCFEPRPVLPRVRLQCTMRGPNASEGARRAPAKPTKPLFVAHNVC